MSDTEASPPLVTIVGFHHARGPEIERWFGVEDGHDPAVENDWHLLPFMALSDGAHASVEDFSYFTLRQSATSEKRPVTSLFGISCTRQMDANDLLNRPPDVTRSTVQKAVVVITDSPHAFGQIREKLSMVTTAWFAQRDFTDLDIIKKFQESLSQTLHDVAVDDQYLGLPLRALIHDFRHQVLVLFKCLLLQPKMLFFGSRCEQLCMMQFSLISLIPGLLRSLQDCADPEMDDHQRSLVRPSSLRTSDRNSLLSYMGLPLQIFGKGSLFGPYTPLQQLDVLADEGTKSYVVGSTNSLLLQQKDRYSDILINLDDRTMNITSTSLRAALSLSVADRRWIDFIAQSVQDTWDDSDPSRPNTMGYMGSEEFIRLQFEEYLLSLVASVKYHMHLEENRNDPKMLISEIEGDPSLEFGSEWVDAWMRTDNFRMFEKLTDSHLFDIVEPRHPCAGALTIEDIQRRLSQQISELHLDERFHSSKEVLGKHLATGQKKVSSAFNQFWADLEVMREAQRKRNESGQAAAVSPPPAATATAAVSPDRGSRARRGPDLSGAQATVSAASSRATAYLSSWASWAADKSRGATSPRSPDPTSAVGALDGPQTVTASASAKQSDPAPLTRRQTSSEVSSPPSSSSNQQYRHPRQKSMDDKRHATTATTTATTGTTGITGTTATTNEPSVQRDTSTFDRRGELNEKKEESDRTSDPSLSSSSSSSPLRAKLGAREGGRGGAGAGGGTLEMNNLSSPSSSSFFTKR